MKAYLAVFRIRFSHTIQYRAAAAAGMVTQYAWGFMELLMFSAFYRVSPEAFPMTFQQTVNYVWIQQAFLALFMTWFWEMEIFDTITSGSIAYEMARPLDLYGRWFCQSLATRAARCVLRALPILLVAFLIPGPLRMTLPPDAGQFVLFLVSTVLALFVVVAFSMLIYISAFYTVSAVGMRVMAAVLVDFLAGGIVPLPFFPPFLRSIAELLPFAAMQNMPLRIYSGNIAGADALWGIALQVFWLVVMGLAGRRWMRRAQANVVVQGG
ncbi:MAG TPA: ABC transporter permease [Candidatus Limiplasma sp.]|nr:ABC transporter permease [Candidatus Limiplasma sp.]HRX08602.1 ABC transporter permease [Candidatus Limiplasma sp.]